MIWILFEKTVWKFFARNQFYHIVDINSFKSYINVAIRDSLTKINQYRIHDPFLQYETIKSRELRTHLQFLRYIADVLQCIESTFIKRKKVQICETLVTLSVYLLEQGHSLQAKSVDRYAEILKLIELGLFNLQGVFI